MNPFEMNNKLSFSCVPFGIELFVMSIEFMLLSNLCGLVFNGREEFLLSRPDSNLISFLIYPFRDPSRKLSVTIIRRVNCTSRSHLPPSRLLSFHPEQVLRADPRRSQTPHERTQMLRIRALSWMVQVLTPADVVVRGMVIRLVLRCRASP
jgi:hypothetical protein